MSQVPVVTIDFETYYDAQYSLSKITTEEYIRSPQFETIGMAIWMPEEPQPKFYSDNMEISRVLWAIDWSTHAVLAHNTAFDGAILGWRYGIHPMLYLDTMSMAQPLFGFTSGVSLAKLAEVLQLGVKGDEVIHALGKRQAQFTPGELHAYGQYCINDTVLCRKIFEHLMPLTPRKELAMIDETLRCFIDPRIVLDKPMLEEHYQQVVDTKAMNYAWASRLLGCEPDDVKTTIMSNEKLAALLRERGVEPPTKLSPTTGKVAYAFAKTDEAFLELKDDPDEAVQLLIECRLGGKSTLAETRALRLIQMADRGALPVYLKYYAALTGRLGGGDAVNMQNLPRKSPLRNALMAPPDHVALAGDLAQIEARILAVIARQQDVVDAFRRYDEGRGPDIYCVTASAFLGRKITKADKRERQLGKVIRLALGYGMGVVRFIDTARKDGVVLTPAEAKAAHTWYKDNSEYITRLWRAGDVALKKLLAGEEWSFGVDGCIVVKADGLHLPSGRIIRYPGLAEESPNEFWRPQYSYLNRKKRVRIFGAKVIENICQALAGSVCADAWLRLRGRMKIVMQVHDELVGVIHESQAEEGCAMMRAAMVQPVKWLPQLPVNCNVGYAKRYGEIEK